MIKFLKNHSLVILVFLLASVIRFSGISSMPPSLNWDEVSHGYNAYSVLKTEKDEWGVGFPGIFRAYGDYKLPVYIYLTAISEAILGLTPLGVRLPSILAGIATVVFTYFLARRLFNQKVAILSSLLVAVEPWSFFLSRGAFEANFSLALIVSGVYFFLLGVEKAKYLLFSAALLGLSVWTYNSARIFVPLLLALLVFLYKKEFSRIWRKDRKLLTFNFALLTFLLLPMFYQLTSSIGQARYSKVAILDEGAISQIDESRAISPYPDYLDRLIYNKGTYFVSAFIGNWLSHFSPWFLFFRGGTHYQFSVPNHGMLYLVNLPFLAIGLISLLAMIKKGRVSAKIVFLWLVLSPVASSLTREAPQALRSIAMLPIPMIVTSLGLVFTWSWLGSKKLVIGQLPLAILLRKFGLITYFILLVFSLKNYLKLYFIDYRSNYSWAWQYGYKEAVDYVKNHYDKYGKIIVTKKYGEPHEFFLFFLGWDPQKYRDDPNLIRFYQSGWFWVDRFDKFYFVNDWDIPKDEGVFVLESDGNVKCQMSNVKCLLITSPGNYPKDWKKLETINFLDGKGAFEIYENN